MTTPAAGGTSPRRPVRRSRVVEAGPEDPDTDPEVAPADAFQRLRRGPATVTGGESDAEDEHAWMTTYTDMVTLLLTCFIMLISLASFTDRDPVPPQPTAPPVAAAQPEPDEAAPAHRLPDALFLRQRPDSWSARLSRDLERFAGRAETAGALMAGGMAVERGETLVTVRLNDRLLFPSGRVEIAAEGLALLHALAPVLAGSPARIEVQGHTDSVPIGSWLFPSNWELSGARAAAVVRALAEGGVPANRLIAAGYADTVRRADNATPEGRQENRRVELVLRTRFDPPEAQPIPAPEAQPIPAPEPARSDRIWR